MLYEFALEPSALYELAKSTRDFRDFIQRFAIGTPEVLSDYPKLKKLRRQVLSGQPNDAGPGEQARLEELLRFVGESPRVKRAGAYNDTDDWKLNVDTEHKRIPFDHILCCEGENGLGYTSLEALYEGAVSYPSQLPVRRVAAQMSATIASMLRLASRVVFVDPYFNDRNSKWLPFIQFVNAALSNKPGDGLLIEVIYGFNKARAARPQFLIDKFRRENVQLANNRAIKFIGVEETVGGEKLHNRYVLTDIGGVFFGIGLDEDDENHQDDVALLNEHLYPLRWSQYAQLEGFELVEEASL